MHSTSFSDYLFILLGLRKSTLALTSPSGLNQDLCHQKNSDWNKRKNGLKTARQLCSDFYEKMKEGEDKGETLDITSTIRPGFLTVVDPLKPWLYPWQMLLTDICFTLRFCRNIIYWEVR